MMKKKKKTAKAPARKTPARKTPRSIASADELAAALRWLEQKGSDKTRDGMAGYGIHTNKAFGVTVANIRALGKRLGPNHALALALWDSGWYEARMLSAFVAEPERVTPALMDRWCRDFDNWALCDTLCFHLFDRTPHAFTKVTAWAARREEFQKRAAFALLATLALHGRGTDAQLQRCLSLIERASTDDRNFVKKSVNWALRAIGERSPELHAQAIAVAERLASAEAPAPRWIGKDALRALASPAIQRRLTKRSSSKPKKKKKS
ncbi:MAG TPA: DNA alkylation repair protein [Polyangiales bacterium]|nr:DNA alkylation repair protein [Polyangiales bacterium]